MNSSLKPLTIATLITLSTITAQAIVTDQEVSKIYTATFDRVPDKKGVDYWLNSGLTIEEIAKSFFDQDETKVKYPDGLPRVEFIEAVYKNLFGRTADKAGLKYWVGELDSGNITPDEFILATINGALDTKEHKDKTILGMKSQVSEDFLNGKITNEEASRRLKDINAKQEIDEKVQAELDTFDEIFSSDEFNGYNSDDLRDRVSKREIGALRAEEIARNDIKAKKLEEQKEADREELDAVLYDSESLLDWQKDEIIKVFNVDGLKRALEEVNEYEASNSTVVTPVTPPSGGGLTGGSGGGSF